MQRGVQAPVVGVEADGLEDLQHGHALGLGGERAGEDAGVARLLGVARGGDERHEGVAQLREQRAQLGRREARLEVLEQHVVGVLEALEAGDVALPQLDVALERGAEVLEVVVRERLLPRVKAGRLRVRDVGGEVGRHADGALVVAPDPADEPRVVTVRVLALRPWLQGVEQAAQAGVGLARVDDALERRGLVGARRSAARRHHRVLVPEEQRTERVEVAQLGHAHPQGRKRGRAGGHRSARA